MGRMQHRLASFHIQQTELQQIYAASFTKIHVSALAILQKMLILGI